MKKLLAVVIAVTLLVFSMTSAFAADKGFGENNKNDVARLYNGFYAPNLYLVMKSSKDWIPQANEPVGAWCTNHFTWYSDDYSEDTWYGYDTINEFGQGLYRIQEFYKIMSVSDDPVAWAEYEAAGAFSAGWGEENGVPRYVVFHDVIEVYDASTGELVYSTNLVEGMPKGLGKPIF
ncbi:MAG TPA: hypothetical protein VHP38_14655 [Ruminiclostridium sp.]|nr:hypothetical protein [Ruminiclostridium sp.]